MWLLSQQFWLSLMAVVLFLVGILFLKLYSCRHQRHNEKAIAASYFIIDIAVCSRILEHTNLISQRTSSLLYAIIVISLLGIFMSLFKKEIK